MRMSSTFSAGLYISEKRKQKSLDPKADILMRGGIKNILYVTELL